MAATWASRPLDAAQLFRETGIFVWHRCLHKLGMGESPARSVFAVSQCLSAFDAGEHVGHGRRSLRDLVDSLLVRYRSAYEKVPLPSDMDAWGPAPNWWDARSLTGHLMAVHCGPYMLRNARRRLVEHGIAVDYVELHDIAATFANDYLVDAMRSFDPSRGEGREEPWITTVFFRYALPRVAALRTNRANFELTVEVGDTSTTPESMIEARRRFQLLEQVEREVQQLPDAQRTALQHYFGFDTHEHTLSEVAGVLGTSVHMARLAITAALGSLASRMQADAVIGRENLELARLLFQERLDVREAASSLGISSSEARSRAKSLSVSLRASLRARTTSRIPSSFTKSGGPVSTSTPIAKFDYPNQIATGFSVPDSSTVYSAAGAETLLTEAARAAALAEAQAQRVNTMVDTIEAQARVQPGSPWKGRELAVGLSDGILYRDTSQGPEEVGALDRVRDVLARDAALYDRLATALEAIGDDTLLVHLFAPLEGDFDLVRRDISEYQDQLDALVGDAARSSHAIATAIVGRLPLELTDSADGRTFVDRVRSSLAVALAALDSEMPWDARKSGGARLSLWKADGQVSVAWMTPSAQASDAFDMVALLADRLISVGGFYHEESRALAESAAEGFMDGTIELPGFERQGSDEPERRFFLWTEPTVDLVKTERTQP
jgi:DNA-directed RNA polymerase specialized sigma24 family protein